MTWFQTSGAQAAWRAPQLPPAGQTSLEFMATRYLGGSGHVLYGGGLAGQGAAGYGLSWSELSSGRAGAGQKPLRVAHVSPCLMRGGAEQWLIGLARFLDPMRARVVRCVATQAELVDPGIVSEIPAPVEIGGSASVQSAARDADLLISWGVPLDDLMGATRARLSILVAHGDGPWTREMLDRSRAHADHVVAVSRAVKERACQGFPTTVIANGVDTARLGRTRDAAGMRAQLNFEPDDFVLGYVGRYSPEKRPEVLIDAVARLDRRYKALFVGWGPFESELMQLANARIPGRFAFARAANYLGDFYQVMNALCVPSAHEGYSLVMLEAMMCGLPVIATPVGAVPDVIEDRVHGLIIDFSAQSLAQAAQLLYNHPDWARGLGAAARVHADRVGHCRRMAADYEALFAALWAGKTTAA
jgi:hypothetical protein